MKTGYYAANKNGVFKTINESENNVILSPKDFLEKISTLDEDEIIMTYIDHDDEEIYNKICEDKIEEAYDIAEKMGLKRVMDALCDGEYLETMEDRFSSMTAEMIIDEMQEELDD